MPSPFKSKHQGIVFELSTAAVAPGGLAPTLDDECDVSRSVLATYAHTHCAFDKQHAGLPPAPAMYTSLKAVAVARILLKASDGAPALN